jgi:hypothetical protein
MTLADIERELDQLDIEPEPNPARRAELEQLLADAELRQKQFARYPIVSGLREMAGETFLTVPIHIF